MTAMEIASSVRNCLAKFKTLLDESDLAKQQIEDEYGRLRTWAGNISAHRTGRRSLEYRLRDSSNLQATVTSLLRDLLGVLEQLLQIVSANGLEHDRNDAASSQDGNQGVDSEDDNDAELFGFDDEDSSPQAVFAQALDEAHEIITCLLRFSMTLRNPARHDQLKQAAATTTKHFEPHDINHVQEKYPAAAGFLHRRLGKAISKHRQYFKYREEHHLKLAEGLDDAQEGHGERPSTIATSLNQSDKVVSQVSLADTEGETESVYTATSFAPTTAGHASLKPPPLPEAGQNGDPFECPLCYGIVVAEDQRSWRQHVFEDLPPYVCTFESCLSADYKYSRRRDWQRHMAKSHNRHWVCPFGCAGKMITERVFKKHLMKKHSSNLDDASIQRMADACAIAEELSDLTCPLCKDVMPNTKRWYKHLGHHLEQFALHALPQHVISTDSDDDEAEIVDDSEDALSAREMVDSREGHSAVEAAPVRFLDAIGREHSFPFELCRTFHGIETLIKDAFRSVKSLDDNVARGQYDLYGPDDEIIAKRDWEANVRPGWKIRMQMRPLSVSDSKGWDWESFNFLNPMLPQDTSPVRLPSTREMEHTDLEDRAKQVDNFSAIDQAEGSNPSLTSQSAAAEGERVRRITLNEALRTANVAVQFDKDGNWGAAIDVYEKACRTLQQVANAGVGEEESKKLRAILHTYNDRIAELRQFVYEQPIVVEDLERPSDDTQGEQYPAPVSFVGDTGTGKRDLIRDPPHSDTPKKMPAPTDSLGPEPFFDNHDLAPTASESDDEGSVGRERAGTMGERTSNKRHKCPYCDMEFTRHQNLRSHLLIHSQEKPYICQTCEARFRRLHDLKRHMKLHDGERPHVCQQCGRRFARADALARHNSWPGGCAGRRSSFGGDDEMLTSDEDFATEARVLDKLNVEDVAFGTSASSIHFENPDGKDERNEDEGYSPPMQKLEIDQPHEDLAAPMAFTAGEPMPDLDPTLTHTSDFPAPFEGKSVADMNAKRLKKGKTRMPKRLARREAIMELGYPFDEEEDFFVLRYALEKEQIDEVILISKRHQGSEQKTEKGELDAQRDEGHAVTMTEDLQDWRMRQMDESEKLSNTKTRPRTLSAGDLPRPRQDVRLDRLRLRADTTKRETGDLSLKDEPTNSGDAWEYSGPVYPKIHCDYLSEDTLKYYEIPYRYDENDSDYMIILREMDKYETEVLFEHTRNLRSGDLLPESLAAGKKREGAYYRKRDRSSGRIGGTIEFKK